MIMSWNASSTWQLTTKWRINQKTYSVRKSPATVANMQHFSVPFLDVTDTVINLKQTQSMYM